MSEKTLLKRLDKINDLIFEHSEKNYEGNLRAGGEGRTVGKREKKVEKLFKERATVRKALEKLRGSMKPRGGGSVGGNTVGNLATGSRNKTIKKLMENM